MYLLSCTASTVRSEKKTSKTLVIVKWSERERARGRKIRISTIENGSRSSV